MAQYLIHEGNMDRLKKKLNRIHKKCAKYGNEFNFEIVGEEYIPNENGTEFTKYCKVEVSGVAKLNDYQFVATIQHLDNGNVIKSCSNIELPEKYRTIESYCEHCNTNRYRKETYIIQHMETKEFKQIGKNCLASYLGIDAEAYAHYVSLFDTVMEFEAKSPSGYRPYLDVKDYLLNVIETIKHYGYINKDTAEITGEKRTCYKALDYMNRNKPKGLKKELERINYDPYTKENEEYLEKMLKWLNNHETKSTFIHNLQVICSEPYVEYNNLPILAALVPAYHKAMETEKERLEREARKAQMKISKFVGNVGDKIEMLLKYIRLIPIYTQFGASFIHLFKDENGNIFKWSTSKCGDFSEGDVYKIKGTIKGHEVYNDINQTVITRCNVLAKV